jgi:hypothetical protein
MINPGTIYKAPVAAYALLRRVRNLMNDQGYSGPLAAAGEDADTVTKAVEIIAAALAAARLEGARAENEAVAKEFGGYLAPWFAAAIRARCP